MTLVYDVDTVDLFVLFVREHLFDELNIVRVVQVLAKFDGWARILVLLLFRSLVRLLGSRVVLRIFQHFVQFRNCSNTVPLGSLHRCFLGDLSRR